MRAALVVVLAAIAIVGTAAGCRRAPRSAAEAAQRGTPQELRLWTKTMSPAAIDSAGLLTLAVVAGNAETADYLMRIGADANHPHPEGSLLHVAARAGDLRMVRTLLNGGADWRAVDSEGRTALLVAVSAHHLDIQDTLREVGTQTWHRRRRKNEPEADLEAAVLALDSAGAWSRGADGREHLPIFGDGDARHEEALRISPGGGTAAHRHQVLVRVVVAAGAWAVASGSDETVLGPGDFVSIPPEVAHRETCRGPDPCYVIEQALGAPDFIPAVLAPGRALDFVRAPEPEGRATQFVQTSWRFADDPESGYIAIFRSDYHQPLHRTAHGQHLLVIAGHGTFAAEGIPERKIGPLTLLRIPGGTRHRMACDPPHCVVYGFNDGPN